MRACHFSFTLGAEEREVTAVRAPIVVFTMVVFTVGVFIVVVHRLLAHTRLVSVYFRVQI